MMKLDIIKEAATVGELLEFLKTMPENADIAIGWDTGVMTVWLHNDYLGEVHVPLPKQEDEKQ